jgi:hypothetical protein
MGQRPCAGEKEDEDAKHERNDPSQDQQPLTLHGLAQPNGDSDVKNACDQSVRTHHQHQHQRGQAWMQDGNHTSTNADQAKQENQPPFLIALSVAHGANDRCHTSEKRIGSE